MEKKYDVIIVGAGISGGLIASRLSKLYKNNQKSEKNKLRVLILEAGEDRSNRPELVETYLNAANKSPGSPYKIPVNMAPSPDGANDYYDQSEAHDNNQFKSTYERRVGGSTWHWLGNCPRLLPSDFKSNKLYGLGEDWPITYDDLEPWYCEAEHEIGVSGDHDELNHSFGAFRTRPFPMHRIWPSYSDIQISKVLKNADDTHKAYNDLPLVLVNTPQARNSQPYNERPVCTGNSSCVPICPVGAKYDATIHIEKATDKKNRVDLISKAVVTGIQVDPETGKIATVSYKSWDDKEHIVAADLFVLAANGIETPKILLMSRLPGNNDHIGRYLMDHPQGEGVCFSREPLFPFRGPPTTSGIDKFRDGAFRKDSCAFRLSMGNDGGGRTLTSGAVLNEIVADSFGSKLKSELNQKLTRLFRISFLAEMRPLYNNRVTLSPKTEKFTLGIPVPKIDFTVDGYTMNSFEKISAVMQSILKTLNPVGDILLPNNQSEHKGAGHIMGTCRMGTNKTNSVVDRECRSHEHPNLFIGGSSVFPTVGTANPTLTVAALSLRIADSIKKQLKLIS
jgi:choline dehydrogenase-like flavoprotein